MNVRKIILLVIYIKHCHEIIVFNPYPANVENMVSS